MSVDATNSSTASESSKWPTLRRSAPIAPRISGIRAAATRRRSSGPSVAVRAPPNAGTSALLSSSHEIARLMIPSVTA